MKHDITFIHTAEIHVATFDRLVSEAANKEGITLAINHVVKPFFLSHAQQYGVDVNLEAEFSKLIAELRVATSLIVVTCSSIGALAEQFDSINGCQVQRIDRAMANYAVSNGNKILAVAALESTLIPTRELLKSSVNQLGLYPEITLHHIDNIWDYLQTGDLDRYYAEIAKELELKEKEYDLILLAQASMMGVEDMVNVSIPIISSPRLGVQRAINTLRPLGNTL